MSEVPTGSQTPNISMLEPPGDMPLNPHNKYHNTSGVGSLKKEITSYVEDQGIVFQHIDGPDESKTRCFLTLGNGKRVPICFYDADSNTLLRTPQVFQKGTLSMQLDPLLTELHSLANQNSEYDEDSVLLVSSYNGVTWVECVCQEEIEVIGSAPIPQQTAIAASKLPPSNSALPPENSTHTGIVENSRLSRHPKVATALLTLVLCTSACGIKIIKFDKDGNPINPTPKPTRRLVVPKNPTSMQNSPHEAAPNQAVPIPDNQESLPPQQFKGLSETDFNIAINNGLANNTLNYIHMGQGSENNQATEYAVKISYNSRNINIGIVAEAKTCAHAWTPTDNLNLFKVVIAYINDTGNQNLFCAEVVCTENGVPIQWRQVFPKHFGTSKYCNPEKNPASYWHDPLDGMGQTCNTTNIVPLIKDPPQAPKENTPTTTATPYPTLTESDLDLFHKNMEKELAESPEDYQVLNGYSDTDLGEVVYCMKTKGIIAVRYVEGDYKDKWVNHTGATEFEINTNIVDLCNNEITEYLYQIDEVDGKVWATRIAERTRDVDTDSDGTKTRWEQLRIEEWDRTELSEKVKWAVNTAPEVVSDAIDVHPPGLAVFITFFTAIAGCALFAAWKQFLDPNPNKTPAVSVDGDWPTGSADESRRHHIKQQTRKR